MALSQTKDTRHSDLRRSVGHDTELNIFFVPLEGPAVAVQTYLLQQTMNPETES